MAKKDKTVFVCAECGYSTPKWMGQCPQCSKWNSLEEVTPHEQRASEKATGDALKGIEFSSISDSADQTKTGAETRISTSLTEFDRLLGGGLVRGSVVLIGGEPGVGKSTFLLSLINSGLDILYISGEESLRQVQERAKRVHAVKENVTFLHETSLEVIRAAILKRKPKLVFIDSIQTVYSGESRGFAGSVSQIREAAGVFLEIAKRTDVTMILTGHITKDGQIAGPRLLEHAVDVVLYFEHERKGQYRFLRAIKNRFGSTGEIALFEMGDEGLKEVPPMTALVDIKDSGGIGSILFPQMEGSRVLLHEIQVLVTPTGFANGRRIGENIDVSRIHLIAAILEKYMSMKLSECDIFVRVRGGTSLKDPGADLALLVAMASSFLEKPLPPALAAFGEVSLTGLVRATSYAEDRIKALKTYQIQRALLGGTISSKIKNPGLKLEPLADLASLRQVLG